MELLLELLVLFVFMLGQFAAGFIAGNVWPIDVLRRLAGTAPRPLTGDDWRDVVRGAVRAPSEAPDSELVAALFELRRLAAEAAERGASGAGEGP